MITQQELEQLRNQLALAKEARKRTEDLVGHRMREHFQTNLELKSLNESLLQKNAEHAYMLVVSEMRYKLIIETASDIIYTSDKHGFITYANPVAVSKTGYPLDEIIGKNIIEFVHPAYRKKTLSFLESIHKTGEKKSFYEVPILSKSGEMIWLSQNLQVLYQNNEFKEVVSVARDITKRKMAENDLLKNKLRLTNLIANLQSGILLKDEAGKIVVVNDMYCSLFGLTTSASEFVDKDQLFTSHKIKQHFANPEDFIRETENLLKDKKKLLGEVFHLNDGRIIERDYIPVIENENCLGHLFQYRDVTAERKAQEKLRESEEKYRGIIEKLELGLIEVDNEGNIVKAYPRFYQMTGYEESDLTGKKTLEFLIPDSFKPVLKQQKMDRLTGKAGSYEIQILKKDGTPVWVLMSGAPIFDHKGNITGAIDIFNDITLQKKLQKDLKDAMFRAESAREVENEFLTNMSHEIRTPLNAIIGMTHLLYDTQPSAEQKKFLKVLRSSSDILKSLISEVIDLVKIRSGQFELNRKEFDIKELVMGLKRTFQLKLESRPVDIKAEIDPRLKTMVIGDDLLLNQILINLLGNAEKFTTEGKIGIRARIKARQGSLVTVQFEVYDTGIGIAASKLDMIFQSFSQADGDIKRKFGGTGLGLSIVRNLINIQGGSVQVYSEPGKGTTFTFEISYRDSGKVVQEVETGNKGIISDSYGDSYVLIVEDNLINRKYISTLLKKWNVRYKMAVNGRQGLGMAKKERFDAILLDIHMPEMDGYEVVTSIRNSPNPNRNTPVIALTASAMVVQKEKAFKAGMTDYLSKPFTPKQLSGVMHKYLQASEDFTGGPENKLLFDSSRLSGKLDYSYLNEIYGRDTEYASTMYEAFKEKIEEELPDLRQMLREKNWPGLHALSHKLKPAFPMVGLTGLEKYFQSLEDGAAKMAPEEKELESILDEIERELIALLPIVRLEFGKLKVA